MVLVENLRALNKRVAQLDQEIRRRAKEDPVARRLMTIPGVGAITAGARACGRDVQAGTRFCCLGRIDATAKIDRRQGAAGQNIENG